MCCELSAPSFVAFEAVSISLLDAT